MGLRSALSRLTGKKLRDGISLEQALYMAPGEPMENIRRAAVLLREDPLRARAFFDFLFDGPTAEATEDGIAVVKIRGSLYRGMFWDDYRDIGDEIDQALADASVQAILLDIDSPGGMIAGCFDLAARIFEVRGQKPIWAIANDQATSAAYALASASDRVFMTRSGISGSIGAIVTHLDQSSYDEKQGLKWTEVASGARKTDLSSHKPLGKEGKATLQRIVTEASEQFFEVVSAYRDLSVDEIRAQQAALYVGADAVTAGLVDEIATMDEVLDKLRAEVGIRPTGDPLNALGLRTTGSLPFPEATAPQKPGAAETDPPAPTAAAPQPAKETTPEPAAPAAEGDPMSKSVTDPAANPTPITPAAPTAAEIIAQTQAAVTAALAARAEVNKQISVLCKLAGQPGLIAEFITSEATVEMVQEKLLELRAAADAAEPQIRGQHVPIGRGPGSLAVPKFDHSAIYQRWNDPVALGKQVVRR